MWALKGILIIDKSNPLNGMWDGMPNLSLNNDHNPFKGALSSFGT